MNEHLQTSGSSGFAKADMSIAAQQCSGRHRHRTLCPRCEMRVILHCSDCLVQVTGCFCSATERLGEETARKMFPNVAAKVDQKMRVIQGGQEFHN